MHKLKKYQNGLELITVPVKGTKTATIIVMVGTGSKYENKKNNGLSHFLEHMLFKGTKKRPNAMAISAELDALGCEYNAFTSKEFTGFWIKVDSAKIETAAEILSDMFFNSKLEEEEIRRESGVIVEEINMYQDNPMAYIEEVFENLLYGDTPAGWETLGPKENILSLKQEDFLSYISTQYGANNVALALAGDINQAKAEKITSTFFGDKLFASHGKGLSLKELVKENQTVPGLKVKFKKTDQAHLSLGVRAYPYGHKHEPVLKIMSLILGGSMSSRLFINLREREGLAYYVHTADELYSDTGYLTTRAGVPVDKVERAISIIIAEYKKLKADGVLLKELKKVKDMLKGRYAIELESSDHVASWYTRQAVMNRTLARENKKGANHKLMTPNEYLKALDSVTSATIKKVANDIFVGEKLNLAIIGPYEETEKFKKLLVI